MLDAAQQICPKHMLNGPCGGVSPGGGCEVDAALPCPYLAITKSLSWRAPRVPSGRPPQRSAGRLEATLRRGEFALIAEAYTPDSADLGGLVRRYTAFDQRITAINIADHALATPHTSTLAAAAIFERHGLETIVNLTCRDRNRIALQGEILGAAALGVSNLFCITGDHPQLGDHPDATPVYDLDSLQLLALGRRLCDEGRLLSGRPLDVAPQLMLGAAANPFTPPVELQAERVAAKVAAGADFIQTQAIFDIDRLEQFVDQLRQHGALDRAWLIVGVAVVVSLEAALWLQHNVPGAHVPDALIERLRRTPEAARRGAGLAATAELIERLRTIDGISGALLFPLLDDVAALGELLELLPSMK